MTDSPAAAVYLVHGKSIRSEVRLTALAAPITGPPDLEIGLVEPQRMSPDMPGGRTLADWSTGRRQWYSIIEHGQAVTVRFPSICEATLSFDPGRIVVTPDPASDPRLVELVSSGTALATALTLTGHCVLHAAAVEVDGRAVAFLGPSGSGKSTLAAAMCRQGARLLTDDVLVVSLDDDGVTCHRGTDSIRLRPGARCLADSLAESDQEATVDGRLSARFRATDALTLPLTAVVTPRPAIDFRVERLHGAAAAAAVSRGPRVGGWTDAAVLRRWLSHAGKIARLVPIAAATVPPPRQIPPHLADRLLAAVTSTA